MYSNVLPNSLVFYLVLVQTRSDYLVVGDQSDVIKFV